jgi:hypothetical protein
VIIGAGAAFTAVGYTSQTLWVNRRARHRAANGLNGTGTDRRSGPRATRAGDAPLEQQAEDLAAAIDVMVAFVDGAARKTRGISCARQVEALIPVERQGSLTIEFINLAATDDATAADLQELAAEVCVQMAIELRGILGRLAAARPPEPAGTGGAPKPAFRARGDEAGDGGDDEDEDHEDEEMAVARKRRERHDEAAKPRWEKAAEELDALTAAYEASAPKSAAERPAEAPAPPAKADKPRATPKKATPRKSTPKKASPKPAEPKSTPHRSSAAGQSAAALTGEVRKPRSRKKSL